MTMHYYHYRIPWRDKTSRSSSTVCAASSSSSSSSSLSRWHIGRTSFWRDKGEVGRLETSTTLFKFSVITWLASLLFSSPQGVSFPPCILISVDSNRILIHGVLTLRVLLLEAYRPLGLKFISRNNYFPFQAKSCRTVDIPEQCIIVPSFEFYDSTMCSKGLHKVAPYKALT